MTRRPLAPLLALGLAVASPAAAADFGTTVKPFLAKHCAECHGPASAKGDFRVDTLPATPTDPAGRERWQAVRDRIAAGSMPPAKKPRPPAADATAVTNWVDNTLAAAERDRQKAEGRVVLRRLNRAEYENTIRDLLGVHVDVKDLLPADALSHGFDNVGNALSVSAVQMQRYLEAAEFALNAAVARGPRPEPQTKTVSLADGRAGANIGRHWLKRDDGAVVVFTNSTFPSTQLDAFRAAARGRYKVTVRGYAFQSKADIPFGVYTGNFGRGGDTRLLDYYSFRPDTPSSVSGTVWLDPGDSVQVLPYAIRGFNPYDKNKPDKPETYRGAGLAILGVDVEGPLADEWPPRGHTLLFGDLPVRPITPPAAKGAKTPPKPGPADVMSDDPERDAKRLLPGFLSKAFRRPVSAAGAAPYLATFTAEKQRGASFREAMLAAAAAALCSPDFLYLREVPGRLDDFALAARLSYFLGRTAPDDELLKLAAAKQLGKPDVLRAQTERLLKHPNAARFTADFTDAWLNLRDIDSTTPDKQLYPEFDTLLQDSMLKETRLFFDEVVGKNLPAGTFIASDFAVLNDRLAKHYKIAGVDGLAVRRVPLPPGSGRGGLLTQAAVLKVSANGTNTSPVVRGVYVLERFLGIVPPPPPPGVPAVEPDIRGAKTLRDLLDKHRSLETCAGCHRMIDPPGFALEEFDVIGGRREKFRAAVNPGEKGAVPGTRYKLGLPVDSSGELPDGRRFKTFDEFRALLLAEPDRFARCFTEKLLTFATGHEVGPADRPEVTRIVSAAATKKFPVRDLIHAVVQSDVFRTK